MWSTNDYSHDGKAFQTPPRNVLPKPYGGGRTHPPMWVAAGNPPTYEKAARHGLGVLGFNVAAIHDMKPSVDAYKAAIGEATPVGQYVNDNVMITSGVICLPDGKEARERACKRQISYLQSLVFLYHDTFPKPEGAAIWPEQMPEPTLDDVEQRIERRLPPLRLARPGGRAGRALRGGRLRPARLRHAARSPAAGRCEVVRCFGDEVIPKFDTDPVHRTTHMRAASTQVLG